MTIAPVAAAPGDKPAATASAGRTAGDNREVMRTASLPAKGLFVGDQLSEAAKAKLSELVLEMLGMRIEVALIVPTGPWEIDGGTHADNDLTTARLNAVKRFLADRGVPPKHIFVESRIDAKAGGPRMDVQVLGPSADD